MKLKSIEIREIPSYKDNSGQYEGEIVYGGNNGSVTLRMDTTLSAKVLSAIAEQVEEASRLAAAQLHDSIQQSIIEANGKTLALPATT